MRKENLIDGEESVIKQFIKSKDIVFDIGAYVGEWSDAVLTRHPDVVIHQFEPSDISFQSLFNNYREKIKSGQVTQNNCIVSNNEKDVDFYYYGNLPVLSTIYRRNPKIEKHHKLNPVIQKKKSTTIDSYCMEKNIKYINFLKIDTEGCEYNVMKGAEKLLKENNVDYIQFEYGGCFIDAKKTLREVFEFLNQFGYKLSKITSNGLLEITNFTDDWEKYDYCNFLAICKNTK